MSLETIPRDDFLGRYWQYGPGEHVTILGPTKSGKTYLGYQLLGQSVSPKRPGVVLVVKPRDATVASWSRTVGFRTVRTWPPTFDFARSRPPGYVLWPKHSMTDPDRDDVVLHDQCQRALRDCYRRGNRSIFADEAYGLCEELGLERDLIRIWSRGRSMGTGLWVASQKPTHIPLWAYSQAEHLFLHNDPDKRARDRFDEIGGVDPRVVSGIVAKLPRHHFLYVRRDGPAMCVVSK